MNYSMKNYILEQITLENLAVSLHVLGIQVVLVMHKVVHTYVETHLNFSLRCKLF